MKMTEPDDRTLLETWLKQGSESAFTHIVSRYAGLVHTAAARITGDASLAAEVSQLTFITLARRAKGLASRDSLAGWLHLTASMHAKNIRRQHLRETRKRQLLGKHMDLLPTDDGKEVWRELQPAIDDALAALSARDREAILLRFYRSLSVSEIAATLGIATDAARKRLERATDRLQRQLVRRGCDVGATWVRRGCDVGATWVRAAWFPTSRPAWGRA